MPVNVAASPLVIAEGRTLRSAAEAASYLEPVDVAEGIYDAEGRLLSIETGGSRGRVRAAEGPSGRAGASEEPSGDFLQRVDEPANPERDPPRHNWLGANGSYRTVLFELFDDLARSVRGRELRRGGR